jgi:hypothetical protein
MDLALGHGLADADVHVETPRSNIPTGNAAAKKAWLAKAGWTKVRATTEIDTKNGIPDSCVTGRYLVRMSLFSRVRRRE